MRITNFFQQRKYLIASKSDNPTIQELNNNVKRCADALLRQIDWTKYNFECSDLDNLSLKDLLYELYLKRGRPNPIFSIFGYIGVFVAGTLISGSISSYIVSSGDPFHWTASFQTVHQLIAAAVLVLFVIVVAVIFRRIRGWFKK